MYKIVCLISASGISWLTSTIEQGCLSITYTIAFRSVQTVSGCYSLQVRTFVVLSTAIPISVCMWSVLASVSRRALQLSLY